MMESRYVFNSACKMRFLIWILFLMQVIKAEVLFSGFLVEHNIPPAVSDHAGPLFRKMFPDSAIAKKYSCARTKTTAVLNGAMAPEMILSLVEMMKVEPFSLNVDGSNDNDLFKMYPLCVRVFDVNRGHVCLRSCVLPVFQLLMAFSLS